MPLKSVPKDTFQRYKFLRTLRYTPRPSCQWQEGRKVRYRLRLRNAFAISQKREGMNIISQFCLQNYIEFAEGKYIESALADISPSI